MANQEKQPKTSSQVYGLIFPSFMQMDGDVTDLEQRKQKEICEKYKRRDDMSKGKHSEIDVEREEECGICMEMTSKVVLPSRINKMRKTDYMLKTDKMRYCINKMCNTGKMRIISYRYA
ncbi:hypothetical protein QQ045_008453 [Rhodiola kirilowii]